MSQLEGKSKLFHYVYNMTGTCRHLLSIARPSDRSPTALAGMILVL
jgi:hypothetical protein